MWGILSAFIIITVVAWVLGIVFMDILTYRDLQRKLRKERKKNE